MSAHNTRFANEFRSKLSLDRAPIALAFVEGPPEGVAVTGRTVPAACSFWKEAEFSVFYASAEQYFNCPVGAMTMGFDMPAPVSEQLIELVGQMTGCGYITPEEAALSLGCAGMRTFTEISDDRILAVVPGDKLQELTGLLESTLQSNAAVQEHYDQSKAAFAS